MKAKIEIDVEVFSIEDKKITACETMGVVKFLADSVNYSVLKSAIPNLKIVNIHLTVDPKVKTAV